MSTRTIKKKSRKRKGTKEEQELKEWCIRRRSMYRRFWLKDPWRLDAYEAAKRAYKGENKRQKWEYQCADCSDWFIKKNVQIDHINPCGSFLKKEDEIKFRDNLLSGGLQVLCKDCHNKKTKEERNAARNK